MKLRHRAAGVLALLLASCAGVDSQPPAGGNPSSAVFECRWAGSPVVLDGRPDEAAWASAQPIELRVPWLGRAARTRTTARLLWDREYLYFQADMEDRDLFATVKEHNGMLWDNDVFELFFKPAQDKPGYYEFQVNAAGATLELFFPSRGSGGYARFKDNTDFHLEAKVRLDGTLNHWEDVDRGWTVEGRIPWSDFLKTGGRPGVNETWTFALCRYDFSVGMDGPELSTCAPLTRVDFHRAEDYATLKFVGPPSRSLDRPFGIDRRVPADTSRLAGSPEPPLPYRVRPAFPHLKVPCPIAIAHEPGTRSLLLAHQLWPWGGAGKILRIADDPEVREAQELLSLDAIAYGVAFHPDYASNGYLFVGSNGPMAPGPRTTRVTRYTIGRAPPYAVVPGSEKLILEWESDGHNGGDLAFGADGMLYVTSGDGSSDSDRHLSGQDLSRLLAKVLRIDVDHPAPGAAYSIPRDNPFVGKAGVRPETWAYGLRNPWRISIDRPTGDVWVGQNGQDLWEQVYLVHRGENYGWSVQEGSHPFYPARARGPTPITPPLVEHPHSEFRSLTGGFVYRGGDLPELTGTYLYGDWSTGRVWGVRQEQGRVSAHRELASTALQITGFGADSRGEVLICDHGGGRIYRLERAPEGEPRPRFPTKLSETGLFDSVPGHRVAAGLIPYSVNAPLWSDGAAKERYIALPENSRIDVTPIRGWNFPDGTVVVKSFALPGEGGNPGTRRWIETRLLTRRNGQWAGYSYAWNDDQTDATLVGAAGLDRDFGRQRWHFPSRAECMMCHSRASNFVLGLSTLQMNREHDYGGVRDNQLRVLEHLGVLRTDWAAETSRKLRDEAIARGLGDREADEEVRRKTETRDQREPAKSSLLAFPPEKYGALADPSDPKADLDARARAYLHANCAICHVESGGGNALMELEATTAAGKMNLVSVAPLHDAFGLEGAKLVDPGHPERSVLLERMARRGPGQMPPLATSLVDGDAVRLVREWIRGLPAGSR